MDFENELLKNNDFVCSSLRSLVEGEIRRVTFSGLLSFKDCKELVKKYSSTDDPIKAYSEIYSKLSEIKIPGDKLGENNVSNKVEENIKISEKICENKKENKLGTIIKLINDELEKIAYSFGKSGDHEMAYLVEKTIRDMRTCPENNTLANNDKLVKRNLSLIDEAEKLVNEFSMQFPNNNYLNFVKAIRYEMRKNRESDPVKAANNLRNTWNSNKSGDK